jgi:hypothetical protein
MQLIKDEKMYGYFKQHNATAHSKLPLTLLKEKEWLITVASLISASASMQLIFAGSTVR